MHRAPELVRDSHHNSHYDRDAGDYDNCYPVMAHAESEEEAREIAQTLCDEFDYADDPPSGDEEVSE